MPSQNNTQKSFIDSSIDIARSYNFHGLNLNWEFPSTASEMANFGMTYIEAITQESNTSGKPPLLLTVAVYYSSTYRTLAYPIEAISNNLDWINIMSYNLFAPVSGDFGIRAWIEAGLAPDKIVLGLPYFGFAWKFMDSNNHGLFTPANGLALTSDGALGYVQIRAIVNDTIAPNVFNSTVTTRKKKKKPFISLKMYYQNCMITLFTVLRKVVLLYLGLFYITHFSCYDVTVIV
ncbi:hypothetical protein UlMin_002850 [Ulmus minor]